MVCDDNALGRQGCRPPGRAGLVREELAHAAARARLVVRPGLGGHRRPASAHRPRRPPAPRRGLRELLTLHVRLPDAGVGGSRGVGRPPLPGLVGPIAGVLPRGAPPGAGGPHLRVRRVPAGLPDQPPGRPSGPATAAGPGQRAVGRTCSTCSRPSDDDLLAAHGRWYIPGRQPRYLRRNALVALGNVGDGADHSTERVLRHWLAWTTPCWSSTPSGRPGELGRHDLMDGRTVTHLLVTNDFPPKVGGIQAYLWELWHRLDPDSFVILTARSHPEADGLRPGPGGPGHPDRAGGRPGAGPRPTDWSAASARPPVGSAPTWWSSTPPSPSAWSVPHSGSPTPW